MPLDLKSHMLKQVAGTRDMVIRAETGMFCAYHAFYHDGQLNYLQAFKGDAEIHWR